MSSCPRRRHSAHPRSKPLSKTEVVAIHIIGLAVVSAFLAIVIGATQ